MAGRDGPAGSVMKRWPDRRSRRTGGGSVASWFRAGARWGAGEESSGGDERDQRVEVAGVRVPERGDGATSHVVGGQLQ